MGDNRTYTLYEAVVVGLYDLGALDAKGVDVVLRACGSVSSDMDHGGQRGLRSKRDRLEADEIVVSLLAPKKWRRIQAMPHDTDEENDERDSALFDAWGHEASKRGIR